LPANHVVVNDTGVIGRAFPISPSVQKECDLAVGVTARLCEPVLQGLAKMALEPRHSIWADGMEARLRDQVMATDPGRQLIRAIECRSSYCAAEVASVNGIFPYSFKYKFLESNQLEEFPPIFSIEKNEYGVAITIEVLVLHRE